MTVHYQVNIVRSNGDLIDVVDAPDNLDLTMQVNRVGTFSVELPYKFWKYTGRDMRLEFLRTVDKGQTNVIGNTRWLSRRFDRGRAGWPFKVSGFDAKDFLRRLIVAYPAGDPEAEKAGFADDIIKDIGTENLVYNGAATPPRGFKNFQIQSLMGLGATLPTKSISRRILLDVFQEVAQASFDAGIYLAFDVVLMNGVLELQTFAGVRGTDRREGYSTNPLILSEDNGTLADVTRTDDYEDEATVVYAGGQQTGSSRMIGMAYDADRIAAVDDNQNYIEAYLDARGTATQPSLDSEAAAGLSARKPKRSFTARLQETANVLFMQHFNLGDLATAKLDDESADVRIDGMGINWTAKGETIGTQLQGEF